MQDLKSRGGERGLRTELEVARREIESLKKERDGLAARWGCGTLGVYSEACLA
jgi:hypothetical protein